MDGQNNSCVNRKDLWEKRERIMLKYSEKGKVEERRNLNYY